MSNESEKQYSQNQVFTNKQIDYLATPGQTFIGGTIAKDLYFEGVDEALSPYEREYLQSLECIVDIGKAVVADLEGK
jgi:hypothetical protein